MKINEDDILTNALPPIGYRPTSDICWFDFKHYPNEGASLIQKWVNSCDAGKCFWVCIPRSEEMR